MRAIVIAVIALAADARADRAWTAGVQLSSDSDTQEARVGAGVRSGIWKLGLVFDVQPMGGDSDDIDLVLEVRPGAESWGLIGGWRTCGIRIEQGRQWQEQLLLGAVGNLPRLLDGRIAPSFGVEAVSTIVRHGDGLETDWVSFASTRHIEDTLSLSMFVRLGYGAAF